MHGRFSGDSREMQRKGSGDEVEMHVRYRENARRCTWEIQGRCRLQGRCRVDASKMQVRCRVDAERSLGDAWQMHWRCIGDAGKK